MSRCGAEGARPPRQARVGRHALPAAIALALAPLAGCGSNDGAAPRLDAGEGIAIGWRAFEGGDLARAETYFALAVAAEGARAEAHSGLGWTRAYLGDLERAAASLERAATLDFGATGADARAGLAAVRLALGRPASAVTPALEALAIAPAWRFPHRAGVDSLDLWLLLAEAYVLAGGTHDAEAQAWLDRLAPANGLDPRDPATWRVGNRRFASYREALLEAIEDAERRVGSALP